MVSLLNVCSVNVLENSIKLDAPFKLEIIFEVFEHIYDEVVWELIFVATEGNEKDDQTLDEVVIADIREGRHKFILEAPPPKIETLSAEDLKDVTLLLLKVKFREQMFLKVGWFMTHIYEDPKLIEEPPAVPVPEKMVRVISTEDYRVTNYPIKWFDVPENGEEANDDSQSKEPPTSQSMDTISTIPSATSVLNEKVDSLDIECDDAIGANGDRTCEKTENSSSISSVNKNNNGLSESIVKEVTMEDTSGHGMTKPPFTDVTNDN